MLSLLLLLGMDVGGALGPPIFFGTFALDVRSTNAALTACAETGAHCFEQNPSFNTGTVSGALIAGAAFSTVDQLIYRKSKRSAWIFRGATVIGWGLVIRNNYRLAGEVRRR